MQAPVHSAEVLEGPDSCSWLVTRLGMQLVDYTCRSLPPASLMKIP